MEQALIGLIGVLSTAVGAMAWQMRQIRHGHNPSPEHSEILRVVTSIRDSQVDIARHQQVNQAVTSGFLTTIASTLARIEGKLP